MAARQMPPPMITFTPWDVPADNSFNGMTSLPSSPLPTSPISPLAPSADQLMGFVMDLQHLSVEPPLSPLSASDDPSSPGSLAPSPMASGSEALSDRDGAVSPASKKRSTRVRKRRKMADGSETNEIEQEKEARLEKNRQSARDCRQRKKKYIQTLEAKVATLQSSEEALKAQVAALQAQVQQMQSRGKADVFFPIDISTVIPFSPESEDDNPLDSAMRQNF